MSKVLRVNMSSRNCVYESVKKGYKRLGGRGLIARVLCDEVNPKCDPLGSENKLIMSVGLLAGTTASTSGRISIGGKSPLTGTIKESNAGGVAGRMIARLGIKMIIVEGMPSSSSWYLLRIDNNGAELLSADNYVGLNNYALIPKLRKEFGQKVGVISIGGAGELGYKNATIQITDPTGHPCRAAARGGMGSVMGAKKIKAIVLDASASNNIKYIDRKMFGEAAKGFADVLKNHPLTGKVLPSFGTAATINGVNSIGALPTNNFSSGSFKDAEKINGGSLVKIQEERGGRSGHSCQVGCTIGCSNIYNNEEGEYLTSGLEYETIALNGSNCGISSLDAIAEIDRLCDDFGLDTMEIGATIGVCMEAKKLPFGDAEGAIALVREIIAGTGFGRVLGQGAEYAGIYLGVKRIPTVKGQAISAYDPRGLKGIGVTYATSPMGADHTAGNPIGELKNIDPHKKEGQIQISQNLQVLMATLDNIGLCLFTNGCFKDPNGLDCVIKMLKAKTGDDWGSESLFMIGKETLKLENTFNQKAGFSIKDNELPRFFYEEPLPPTNNIFDISKEELEGIFSF